jgi:hypothetical protein
METVYVGDGTGVKVVVRGDGRTVGLRWLAPFPWQDGTDYAWGDDGPGATRLARALIADAVDEDAAIRYGRVFRDRVIARLKGPSWELSRSDVLQEVRRIELEEQHAQCKNRARSLIVKQQLPLTPDAADEMVALLRLHTGAPLHVVECALNEALAELHLEISAARNGSDRFRLYRTVNERVMIFCPSDFEIVLQPGGVELMAPSIERLKDLARAVTDYLMQASEADHG